jgi:hypothetical protein
LTDERTARRWNLLAHAFEAVMWLALVFLIIGVSVDTVFLSAAGALLAVDGAVIGAFLFLRPDSRVRFCRYFVSTRPPNRRPFFLLCGPIDRSAMRCAAIGYLLVGAVALVGFWQTR